MESAHIHSLKSSASENHQLTLKSRCCESNSDASRGVCATITCPPPRLKGEQQDRDQASHAFCKVFGLGREQVGFVHPAEVPVHF